MSTEAIEKLLFPHDQVDYDLEHSGYVHPAYIRKVGKYCTPVDFDSENNLVELEWYNGDRSWNPITDLFGLSLNAKLFMVYLGGTIPLFIKSIVVFKVKRTNYMKVIFDCDLPF